MKRYAIVAAAAALLATLPIGCSTGAPRPAIISHVVFVVLQDPADFDELIADSDATLAHIPGVVSYAAGPPLDSGRENVTADYDLGITIGFKSEEAYSGYVTHPAHTALVARWQPRLTALRIYDFVDPTP
jgi:hypothetical protein